MLPNAVATRRTLELFRTYVCGIWIVKLLLDPIEVLSRLPHSAYEPLGWLLLFGRKAAPFFMDERLLIGLRVVGVASLAAAIVLRRSGWGRVIAGAIACVTLIQYQAIVRATGAINHTETVLLYPVIILFGYDLAERFRKSPPVGEKSAAYGVPLVLTMIAVCCSYSYAGLNRIIIGGLVNYTSGLMTYWCVWRGLDPSYFEPVFGHYVMTHAWLRIAMEVGFPIITVLEASGLVCLAWPKFKWPFLISMAGFHIGVVLMMGILFWEPMVLYVTFFDWQPWIDRFDRRFGSAHAADIALPVAPAA